MSDRISITENTINSIFNNAENQQSPVTIKNIIEEILKLSETEISKLKFLNDLEKEAQKIFETFKGPNKEVTSLPEYLTYQNIQLQIKNIRNDISYNKNLSFLMIENDRYERHISLFENKLKVTSAFIEKENFINSEIKRISNDFINPIEVKIGPGWEIRSGINYSDYKKYAYQWLISGNDWEINKIVDGAKQNYKSGGGKIYDEAQFNNAIIDNLRDGISFVLYENFLLSELKKISTGKNFSVAATNVLIGNNYGQLTQTESNSTPKNWIVRFLLNPWVITIIGGVIIAFIAKMAGWV